MMGEDGTVRIDVVANDQQFLSTMQRIEGRLAQLQEKVSGIGASLQRAFTVITAGAAMTYAANKITEVADAFGNLERSAYLASQSTEEFNAAISTVREISNRTGVAVGSLTSMYMQLGRNIDGANRQYILPAMETLSNLYAISNDKQAAQFALRQLGQAFASGRFQGDEFRSAAENMPEVIRALEQYTGKTKAEIYKMKEQGLLTTDLVIKALAAFTDESNRLFGEFSQSLGFAINKLRTSLFNLLADILDKGGITWALASVFDSIANGVQAFNRALNDVLPIMNIFLRIAGAIIGAGIDAAVIAIGEAFILLAQGVEAAFNYWSKLVDYISKTSFWEAVKKSLIEFKDKVIHIFYTIYDVLVGHSIWPDTVKKVGEWAGKLWDYVKSGVQKLYDGVISFFGKIFDYVKSTRVWKTFEKAFSSNLAQSVIATLGILLSGGGLIVTALASPAVTGRVATIFSGVILGALMTSFVYSFGKLLSASGEKQSLIESILTLADWVITGIVTLIEKAINRIATGIEPFGRKIVTHIADKIVPEDRKNLIPYMTDWGTHFLKGSGTVTLAATTAAMAFPGVRRFVGPLSMAIPGIAAGGLTMLGGDPVNAVITALALRGLIFSGEDDKNPRGFGRIPLILKGLVTGLIKRALLSTLIAEFGVQIFKNIYDGLPKTFREALRRMIGDSKEYGLMVARVLFEHVPESVKRVLNALKNKGIDLGKYVYDYIKPVIETISSAIPQETKDRGVKIAQQLYSDILDSMPIVGKKFQEMYQKSPVLATGAGIFGLSIGMTIGKGIVQGILGIFKLPGLLAGTAAAMLAKGITKLLTKAMANGIKNFMRTGVVRLLLTGAIAFIMYEALTAGLHMVFNPEDLINGIADALSSFGVELTEAQKKKLEPFAKALGYAIASIAGIWFLDKFTKVIKGSKKLLDFLGVMNKAAKLVNIETPSVMITARSVVVNGPGYGIGFGTPDGKGKGAKTGSRVGKILSGAGSAAAGAAAGTAAAESPTFWSKTRGFFKGAFSKALGFGGGIADFFKGATGKVSKYWQNSAERHLLGWIDSKLGLVGGLRAAGKGLPLGALIDLLFSATPVADGTLDAMISPDEINRIGPKATLGKPLYDKINSIRDRFHSMHTTIESDKELYKSSIDLMKSDEKLGIHNPFRLKGLREMAESAKRSAKDSYNALKELSAFIDSLEGDAENIARKRLHIARLLMIGIYRREQISDKLGALKGEITTTKQDMRNITDPKLIEKYQGKLKELVNQVDKTASEYNDLSKKITTYRQAIDLLSRELGTLRATISGLRDEYNLLRRELTTLIALFKRIPESGGALKKADGGFVSGPGGPKDDKVPALLSNGEFVVNAEAVKQWRPILELINSGKLRRYGQGGAVVSIKDAIPTDYYNELLRGTGYKVSRRFQEEAKNDGVPAFANWAIERAHDLLQQNTAATNFAAKSILRLAYYNGYLTEALDENSKAVKDNTRHVKVNSTNMKKLIEVGFDAASKRYKREPADYVQGIAGYTDQFLGDARQGLKEAIFTGDFKSFGNSLLMSFADKFVSSLVDGLFDSLQSNEKFVKFLDNLFRGPYDMGNAIGKIFGGGNVPGADQGLFGKDTFLGKMFGRMGNFFSGFGKFFQNFFSGFSDILSSIFSIFTFNPFAFAEGGLVRGPGTQTSDSITAKLSNGEFVVNAKATQKWLPFLEAINNGSSNLVNIVDSNVDLVNMVDSNVGGIPKFAHGGLVTVSDAIKQSMSSSETRNTQVNVNITGDVSQQTRRTVLSMVPELAMQIDNYRRESGIPTKR